MGRGEEVQRDVWREDLLRKGRLEECRKSFLEDAQSWKSWISISALQELCVEWSRPGNELTFAHFCFAIIWGFVGALA